jgi:uncharacterized damage-inducible protein DinB
MNKATLEGQFGYFRMVLGMTRKLVEQFPEDKLDFRPVPEVRSVSEIVGHNYQFMVEVATAVASGKMSDNPPPKFVKKAEMLKWMDEQIAKFYATFATLTDNQIAAKISAWGEEFPGWQLLGAAYDEHWHHRGQLTVYLRLCGIEPIMLYSYELLQA